jgi:ATP-dependent Clp protease, protease subunit
MAVQITQSGNKARINIIGNISDWRNSSKDFHELLSTIKSNGIVDVEIYINSFGGSVFEANEIANIILGFDGNIRFTLGAVCASAATIIVAQVITQKQGVSIEQYRNGQFMIHNVSASLYGQIKDIESGLQLMRNLQQNAVDAYAIQTGLTTDAVKSMMDKETWMTAKEALAKKFITAIIDKNDSSPQNLAEILNCGYGNMPDCFKNLSNTNKSKIENQMTLEQINTATGKTFANDAEAVNYIANMQAENARLTAERTQATQAMRNTEITNIIDKAVTDKKILPGQKDVFRNLLENSFEATKKLIDGLQPVAPLSDRLPNNSNNGGSGNNAPTAKTYRQLLEHEPDALKALFENNFEEFNRLYKAEYGYDYVK